MKNKPYRASIIESKKVLMQDFHGNYIKNKYGNNAEMLLTDNDSLMNKIGSEYVYKVFYKDKELFDLTSANILKNQNTMAIRIT